MLGRRVAPPSSTIAIALVEPARAVRLASARRGEVAGVAARASALRARRMNRVCNESLRDMTGESSSAYIAMIANKERWLIRDQASYAHQNNYTVLFRDAAARSRRSPGARDRARIDR
jgi:hypothetical protein